MDVSPSNNSIIRKPLTLSERLDVFMVLKSLYLDKQSPTYDYLYTEMIKYVAKKGLSFKISLEEFISELNEIGLIYQKIPSGKYLVIENQELTFERVLYLKKIQKARHIDEKLIYYLDVRIVDNTYTFKKLETFMDGNTNVSLPLEQQVFCHLVSCEGYFQGLFCNILTVENYNKWMVEVVLPRMKDSSVIVTNNKNLMSKQQNTVNRLHSKKYMLKWLQDNNIPCSENMHKAELYQLISQYPKTNTDSEITRIFKASGHDILLLPESINLLSATEKLWDKIRQKINQILGGIYHIKTSILNIIYNDEMCKWSDWDQEIQTVESNFYYLDLSIQLALEYFLDIPT